VLLYVAVHCSVLQCVAVCVVVSCKNHSLVEFDIRCVAVCCSMLQYVAVCCSVLQRVAACCCVSPRVEVSFVSAARYQMCCSVLQHVAVSCGMLQYVSVLQRVCQGWSIIR